MAPRLLAAIGDDAVTQTINRNSRAVGEIVAVTVVDVAGCACVEVYHDRVPNR